MPIAISSHPNLKNVKSKPFIYYSIEKCASSWMLQIMKTIAHSDERDDINIGGYGIYEDDSRIFYDDQFNSGQSNNSLVTSLHYFYSEMFLKNAFQFTFVRNPLDRFISAWIHGSLSPHFGSFPYYFDKKMNKDEIIVTFRKFVDSFFEENAGLQGSPHFGLYTGCLPKNIEVLDFVGKLETFNDDLKYVINSIWDDKETSSKLIGNLLPASDKQQTEQHSHNTNYLRRGIQLEEFFDDDSEEKLKNHYKEDMEIFGYD
jgi:hypothetical protein|tara:strand:+ start:1029 stop:1805 length:777 start_codon:yes stop_codon:yes gene_type:complete